MSRQPISLSPDLRRLRDEGYEVEIKGDHLLIRNVPYVNARREVRRGTLVSVLDMRGDVTAPPSTHVAYFAGDPPCHRDGRVMTEILLTSSPLSIAEDLTIQQHFSSKPASGRYVDYHEKMSTYAAILEGPARSIDPDATARTFPVIESLPKESVFHYMDSASSRAGITAVTRKLEIGKVAIVGLGGTGSYVLDQVSKTPVREIHLFDGDRFSHHNAFRAPGAPSLEVLRAEPPKVEYFCGIYSRMHRHIVPHHCFVDGDNAEILRGMDFVFLCLDRGGPKQGIVAKLEEFGIPFIDVGMGLYLRDDSLYGLLRVTTSTPTMRAHVREKGRIPFSDGDDGNEYASNIQIADLNALNAVLAVIKWKKLLGFYGDFEGEHFSAYTVDGNALLNEDRA